MPPFVVFEPMGRIELPTYSLPWSCSTPELHRRTSKRGTTVRLRMVVLDLRVSNDARISRLENILTALEPSLRVANPSQTHFAILADIPQSFNFSRHMILEVENCRERPPLSRRPSFCVAFLFISTHRGVPYQAEIIAAQLA
jgi:hypothetical protein